jgi:aminoglycoside 6'-N-acetyltransferase
VRAAQLIADGAPLVAVDPDASNLRARAAYAKAAFVGDVGVATAVGLLAAMILVR